MPEMLQTGSLSDMVQEESIIFKTCVADGCTDAAEFGFPAGYGTHGPMFCALHSYPGAIHYGKEGKSTCFLQQHFFFPQKRST
jgi:hypothetical protein